MRRQPAIKEAETASRHLEEQPRMCLEELEDLVRKRPLDLESAYIMMRDEIEQSERRFSGLIDGAPIAMLVIDRDGTIEYVNKKHVEIMGYDVDDIPTLQCWWALAFPDEPVRRKIIAAWYEIECKVLRGESVAGVERRVVCKDRTIKDLELRFTRAIDRIIVSFDNITERKMMQETLLETKNRYKLLVESVTDYIYTVQVEKGWPVVTSHGPNCVKVTGFTAEEYKAETLLWHKMIHDEDRSTVMDHIRRTLAGESRLTVEHRIIHKDGSTRWVMNTSVPHYKEGILVSYDGIIRDITARKNAEEELNKNRLFLHSILNNIQDGLSVLDTDLNFVMINRSMAKFLGLPSSANVKKYKCYQLIHGRTEPCNECLSLKAMLNRQMYSKIHIQVLPDGSEMFFDVSSFPFIDNMGNVVGVIECIRDITERVKYETALIESENKYRTLYKEFNVLLESLTDMLLLLSLDLKIVWMNGAAARYYGGKGKDLIGQFCYRSMHKRDVPCEDCHPSSALKTGEITTYLLTLAGRTMSMRAFPIRDESEKIRSVLLIGQDITEKLKLEDIAKRTYHLAQLGQLSAGIAHEINNPNNVILSSSQMMRDIWEDIGKILLKYYSENGDFLVGGIPFSRMRDNVPAIISRTTECSLRISDIVSNLKDYVGHEEGVPNEEININRLVAGVLFMLSTHIENCTDNFRSDLTEGLPVITGNSNALGQVIINIIMNSLQALPDREMRRYGLFRL